MNPPSPSRPWGVSTALDVGCTTSSKTCRVIVARARHNSVAQSMQGILQPALAHAVQSKHLETAARTIRQHLEASPSWPLVKARLSLVCGFKLDLHMKMLLDVPDSRYILKEDAAQYHRVSPQYVCTDNFLWHFLASLLHPTTKASKSRVLNHLHDKCEWNRAFIPTDGNLFKSLCEALLNHPQVTRILVNCRDGLDTRVLKIDGQYSAFLSILFQSKHGTTRAPNPFAPNLHVALTVLSVDGVLNVHPASSESKENQYTAINEGLGRIAKSTVLTIVSDNPVEMDCAQTYRTYDCLECLIKDPLHIPLKAEQAFKEKTVEMTALMRRCAIKFKHGYDDRQPFYKKSTGGTGSSTLPAVKASMTPATAQRRINAIKRDTYPEEPYTSASDFVKDLSAIAIKFPKQMRRKIKNGKTKTTVYGSIVHATKREGLGYLFNHSRFLARHADIPLFYGTTASEAFHNQFKAFFRNVFHQTGRNARLVCRVVVLAKLLVAKLRKDNPHVHMPEHELLQLAVQNIQGSHSRFSPSFDVQRVDNPRVNVDLLPREAKRLCKRPAHQ